MRRLIIPSLAIAAAVITGTAHQPSVADAPAATSTVPATTTTTEPPVNHRSLMETGVTVPATTTIPVGDWRHPQWIALAVQVGWPNDPTVLATLDLVIQRESNGRPEAWNRADPMTGSYGITQINGFWCTGTKYHPAGFMQGQGIGVTDCASLFDPAINLRAALVIWQRQGGFGAWSTV